MSIHLIQRMLQINKKRDKEKLGSGAHSALDQFPLQDYYSFINKIARRYGVYDRDSELWTECFSSAGIAYTYSIYRCLINQYQYIDCYIKKVIRIYICCTVILFNVEHQDRYWDAIEERKQNRNNFYEY